MVEVRENTREHFSEGAGLFQCFLGILGNLRMILDELSNWSGPPIVKGVDDGGLSFVIDE